MLLVQIEYFGHPFMTKLLPGASPTVAFDSSRMIKRSCFQPMRTFMVMILCDVQVSAGMAEF